MASWQLQFRLHAVQRMYQRQITPEDIRVIMEQEVVIEEYPADTPHHIRVA